MVRHAAAIGAGRLVDEVLGNDGFKTGEVVELENLARLDQPVSGMGRHIHAHAAAQQRKAPHAPFVQGFVNLVFRVAAHWVELSPLSLRVECSTAQSLSQYC